MNPDSDFQAPDTEPQSLLAAGTAFLPLVLLSISFALLLIWQITTISQQRDAFRGALANLEAQFQQSTPQHEQLLAQSRTVQAKLEALVLGVLDLAKSGDADAKAIIEKYKISQQGTPGAAGGGSPAASPAASSVPGL